MGVNYKLGADVGAFKQGMQEAQASLKTLDAQLKNNEASLKAGGNAQIYMEQKTRLLNDKMQQQRKMADQLKDAMKKMAESGVSKTSVEYQRMYQQLLQAQTGMNETSYALNHLTEAEQEAAGGADALTKSVNSIGKKISLDQVINGIGTITGAMEKAAGKAVQLGEAIWDNVMNSAKWADETQTIAQMYEIPLERYLKMQKLAQYETETSVDAMLKSQQKLKKNIGSGGDSFYQTLIDLGLAFENVGKFGETSFSLITNDADELFWKAGQAIMGLSDAFDKEAIAQEVFGKGWLELYDLFKKYGSKEAYDQALEGVHTNTEQEVSDLSALNDKVAELQGNIETLRNKGWAALAPELTGAADALNGLMGNVLKYLDTPEGKEALESLGTSVSGLFEDLGKINPESVVENFTKVFDKLVGGFKWINEHKGELKTALTVIAGGWAMAKLTGGALQVLQLINGITGLTAGSAAAAGAAAGTSWGGAFATAVLAAAPWLAGLITLFWQNSGDSEWGQLWDQETGEPTAAGREAGITYNIKDTAAKGVTPEVELIDAAEALQNASEALGDTADVLKKGTEEKKQDGTIAPPSGILPTPDTKVRQQGESIDLNKVIDISIEKFLKTFFGEQKSASESRLWDPDQLNMEIEALGIPAKLETAKQDLAGKMMEILSGAVGDFIIDSAEKVANTPEAVKQVTNATPEQNRNAFQTIIDTFLNGMQEGGGGSHGFGIPVEPELEDEAQEQLQKQASKLTVQIGARIVPVSFSGGGGGGGGGKFGELMFHANGIWSVPFDGYPAILHRGEQVVPAREVSSRSYNSNLYVEKMIMNNGTDAEGLASAMAAAQRRRMSGYGS